MELQAKISEEKLQAKVGQVLEVLIDEYDAEEGVAIGRTKADAPEIDGLVYIEDANASIVGKIVNVKIEEADVYDLYGRLI